ncbi:UDP-N-acetylglucosamine--N-acetylmuramyl-(pentapeptide) pyrophosphoryl-undecaprenol N-acetylglucosamine transferase [uncultured Defluviicoccus sp.]|uniref:UDP-N-acetylglucosamine--N-acetylmuramyl-(Pentapeptide) pyrophosphoryl-undecaprenol N-acetylglucosamine transferase n=1 Tax=metagenome TaxID=256318 RepID=A0A380TAC9_9ZZZZ|nr:UDP-N-acetylglucosamine--N-acetylmuramyl-(pentapeptide) pyrophosphoryl-undecaprenol N-acetylglucosamine transferase [uncultured Defluviicoccus sp.]
MNGAPWPLIVLAAGGTGGHIFPAEALAAALAARGARTVLFTDRRGGSFGGALAGVEVCRIRAGGIAGLGIVARLRSIVDLGLGLVQALLRLRRLAPDAVVGFGGYASLPTVLAACWLGCPSLVHEQNAVLGRANRLLAGRVERIATAFEKLAHLPAAAAAKLVRTGMPVRPAFAGLERQSYPAPAADGAVRLLVLGGSQGARVLSTLVPAAIGLLPSDLRRRLAISQQCRPEDLEAVRSAYAGLAVAADLATFFDNVPSRLAAAHLVIARAGASTVAELTTVGRPAILIPYPYATDDHQAANAQALAAAGAAVAMTEAGLTAERLAGELAALLGAPDVLAALAAKSRAIGIPDAGDRLADLVMATARRPHLGLATGKGTA